MVCPTSPPESNTVFCLSQTSPAGVQSPGLSPSSDSSAALRVEGALRIFCQFSIGVFQAAHGSQSCCFTTGWSPAGSNPSPDSGRGDCCLQKPHTLQLFEWKVLLKPLLSQGSFPPLCISSASSCHRHPHRPSGAEECLPVLAGARAPLCQWH